MAMGPGGALRIGTHSGTFHADEALGCFLLRRTARFRDAGVTRSRDPEVHAKMDALVDVGAVYCHEKHRYDHHQRGFDETFGHGFGTKLSSAGLVYKHFGREIVSAETGLAMDHPDLNTLYLKMYKHFVEAVDAVDNGIDQYEIARGAKRDADGKEKCPDDGATLCRKYLSETSIGHRVAALNAQWNEDSGEESQNARFDQASELIGSEFLSKLKYYSSAWLPARSIVSGCLADRLGVDPSGQVIELPRYCPWQSHLVDLEEELAAEGQAARILYCVFQDDREKKWRITCVPEKLGQFGDRKSLPKAWRGLRDADLDKVAGIEGCTFVHSAGFTGGHNTREGILQMARKAVENKED